MCLKTAVGKGSSPTKQTLKRKAAESHASAAVAANVLSSTAGDVEPSAKKAAVVRTEAVVSVPSEIYAQVLLSSWRQDGKLRFPAGLRSLLTSEALCGVVVPFCF